MDEFGMLARDLGFKPQGKSAPMASSKSNIGMTSDGGDHRARSSSYSSFPDDQNRDDMLFSEVFGGPPKYSSMSTSNNKSSSPMSDFDYDSFFKSSSSATDSKESRHKSVPVYDKPVYDDDIDSYDNQSGQFDLLGNLVGTEEVESKSKMSSNSRGFDDLIPGFSSSSPTGSKRSFSDSSQSQKPTVGPNQTTSNVMEDPFSNLGSTTTSSGTGLFTDPLEEISNLGSSGGAKMDGSSAKRSAFDDIDPLNGFGKYVPPSSSKMNNKEKDGSPTRTGLNMSWAPTTGGEEPVGNSSFRNSESSLPNKMHDDSFQDSNEPLFDMPAASTDSHETVSQTTYPPSSVYGNPNDSTSPTDVTRSEDDVGQYDDIWLTVSEIPLFTQPTRAPPPSRPPPPVPARVSKSENGFFTPNARRDANDFSASRSSNQNSRSPNPVRPTTKSPKGSQIDELEAFAMGRAHDIDEHAEVHIADDMSPDSGAAASAAAMKDAMDRAEAKFKHAKEVREREYAKDSRSKGVGKDDQATEDTQEREFRENQEKLERERRQREREEEEREQRKLEKEKERLKEMERQRELARHAVERATREARERAGAEARERAAAEARLKAQRAAVQRAQAEARERAAADAKERAQRAAAEARQRANVEAKEKEAQEKAAVARAETEARRRAERAAVDRAAAEARLRAAAGARERAAAAAATKANQQKNDNDLESFFGMGSRPSSAPRPRANSSDPVADQSKVDSEASRRTSSVGASSNMRKASSTTNIVDDLSSIFGAVPSSGDFQDVEGETEERRRARLERHQRTQERATKALAEKNQRDLQAQRDQEERHRIAGTLDLEIKRWSAGKEGNLRALLSTLQYVLWPECGWQPVSLTDLIVGASVKKAYRKATLCIHPDKVQQKGANLQQTYIAEKVFDLLKEAWNKFNSEELF